MDKELQKLEDLEWEYETAQMLERKGKLDKAEVIVSFHKYKKQLDKVVKMQQEGKGNPDYKVAVDGV